MQFIKGNGKKRFLADGRTTGGTFQIPAANANACALYIVEGYATGASVHMATGAAVLVAFNTGNLLQAAKMARKIDPERSIIICADDDRQTKGNPGLTKATEAARSINAHLAIPRFTNPEGNTDFNDLHAVEGLDAVKACLAEATSACQAIEQEMPAPIPFANEPPPIDPDIVPEPLRGICQHVADAIQVPFELALANAFGCLAVATQRKIKVLVWPGYSEPLSIYILCPLPPGERKSSTVNEFKRPLMEWQTAKAKELTKAIRAIDSERKTLERVIEQKRAMAAKSAGSDDLQNTIEEIIALEDSMPELPTAPRLLADDFTPEALAPLIARHEQRIGVLEAEGGLFDILGGRYSKGVPNLDAVLKFWSGESCQIDRRSREPIFLDDPHLTMVISPQPELVQGLASKPGFRGRGLLGRFLYFLPKSLMGSRTVKPRPLLGNISENWRQIMERLLNLPWAKDEHGDIAAHRVELESEAFTLWQEFAEAVEVELRHGGAFEHMTDWAGKYPGQAIRLAGLLHAATVTEPHALPISAETMQSALRIAEVFATHSKAAYGLMGSNSSQECAQAILRWIQRDRTERFTARDAHRAVRGRFATMDLVKPGLAVLEDRAFIFEEVQEASKRPGRKPSTTYVVNPRTWGEG